MSLPSSVPPRSPYQHVPPVVSAFVSSSQVVLPTRPSCCLCLRQFLPGRPTNTSLLLSLPSSVPRRSSHQHVSPVVSAFVSSSQVVLPTRPSCCLCLRQFLPGRPTNTSLLLSLSSSVPLRSSYQHVPPVVSAFVSSSQVVPSFCFPGLSTPTYSSVGLHSFVFNLLVPLKGCLVGARTSYAGCVQTCSLVVTLLLL